MRSLETGSGGRVEEQPSFAPQGSVAGCWPCVVTHLGTLFLAGTWGLCCWHTGGAGETPVVVMPPQPHLHEATVQERVLSYNYKTRGFGFFP